MDSAANSYRQFLNGDETAFDDIMNELFDGLVFFVNRYVDDFHIAEDIAIDAFSDLVVYRHRYNFKVKLKTYLYMIGRSRALNYVKRRRMMNEVDLIENTEHSADKGSEVCFLSAERDFRLNEALKSLNEDMQIAVHLVYFDDMTYKEAAAVMKKNVKQVDNLLYRAKCELRLKLEKETELFYDEF